MRQGGSKENPKHSVGRFLLPPCTHTHTQAGSGIWEEENLKEEEDFSNLRLPSSPEKDSLYLH